LLAESCPLCHARSGLRCQIGGYGGKPARLLHAARGWRQRPCPTCKAQPGEPCHTPGGRQAGKPHAVRLARARRELLGDEQVWQELERWGACRALVRFWGGGGSPGSIAAVTLEGDGDELARSEGGSGELAEALADPIWGRYALFGGHPRITGLLQWDVREREVLLAGKRGERALAEVLSAPRQLSRAPVTPVISGLPDDGTSPGSSGVRSEHDTPSAGAGALPPLRSLRRAARGGAASRGALLLQALPPGVLARASEGPPFLPAARRAGEVCVVRGADARRFESGGAVLLQALPPGVLAASASSSASQLRGPGLGRHVWRCGVSDSESEEREWLIQTTIRSRRSSLESATGPRA
jgi:hypothetical protein